VNPAEILAKNAPQSMQKHARKPHVLSAGIDQKERASGDFCVQTRNPRLGIFLAKGGLIEGKLIAKHWRV